MATAEALAVDPAEWIARQHSPEPGRPWVTLSYAQSLDGCIAREPGQPTELSSRDAMRLTHRLRVAHDAILVGIGTVLADDPQLTVRLAPGDNPRPVILDANLRTPLSARLLQPGVQRTLIAHADDAEPLRVQEWRQAGARLLPVQRGADGRLDLFQVLRLLHAEGIQRVMVEGGARVIQAFLVAGLVNWAVITISPRWLGGLPAVTSGRGKTQSLPHLLEPFYQVFGTDVIVSGRVAQ